MGGYCVLAFSVEKRVNLFSEALSTQTLETLLMPEGRSGEDRCKWISLLGEDGRIYTLVSYQSRRDYDMQPAARIGQMMQEELSAKLGGSVQCGVGGFCAFYEMIPFSFREAQAALAMPATGKTIRNILRFVEENFADPELSNGVIAKASFLNYSYMCTQFHTEMGMTLNQYIRMYRMRRALRHLEEPGISIQAAALRVGYDDCKYFSKCFKREFNMTPGRYQRRSAGI